MRTPVAFIIFNRPDTTAKVFELIRQAKPPKLFVIADGWRHDRDGEIEKCQATRAIIQKVDWECEVFNNYSNVNLGCAKRVSSGLNWVFEEVEEAIILEDDCLPHPTLFQFCEELLEQYRYDERIASISGQNVQFGKNNSEYSYYFSRYNHIWGWATWRRAWQNYDFEMKNWHDVKSKKYLKNILLDERRVYKWTKLFQLTYDQIINTWDYQWQLTCWLNNSLGITSSTNLISNIGFGAQSTNTLNASSRYANIPSEAMVFPLKHPIFRIPYVQADDFTDKTLFNQGTLFELMKAELKYFLNRINLIK
jgi:hypothetical protein